eukprot:CAMPEP_0196747088 /NCGR_PEP_ID=MMETSP1091-20130531/68252_1 /TAXON_ID=302021 /ORGANISM="Rhodomonas sp., Strain CCMP768" /LENGTH=165 /DNA_ID=CAMNT_0042094163 /DNA_START=328 /DNA_END=826 /DNA_ORIENTATION=-
MSSTFSVPLRQKTEVTVGRKAFSQQLANAFSPLLHQTLVHDEEVLVLLQADLRVAGEDLAPGCQILLLYPRVVGRPEQERVDGRVSFEGGVTRVLIAVEDGEVFAEHVMKRRPQRWTEYSFVDTPEPELRLEFVLGEPTVVRLPDRGSNERRRETADEHSKRKLQ